MLFSTFPLPPISLAASPTALLMMLQERIIPITLILIVLFFYLDVMQGNLLHTLVAIVLVAGISFLFTTVAANAIAIVGTNPVSGMTLMTLILASVVMVAVGLKGPSGMVAALVMGGVVCTALSMAGGFITDLKIGYWLGSTPAKQETWKFLGTIVSAATVGGEQERDAGNQNNGYQCKQQIPLHDIEIEE